MKSFSTALAALIFSAAATNASAATAYKCDMHSKGFGGFVGDVMIFILDRNTGQGMVFDGIIKTVSDKPISAQVTKRKDTIWRYKWEVNKVPLSNSGLATVSMRAMLNIGNGKVTVSGRLGASDNNISGAGKCSVIK